MKRHGSESYFILGEGLLAESLDGRPETMSAAVEATVPPFRFSRMGPRGTNRQLGEANRTRIAKAMTAANLTPGTIPAGFTYLGQFIDHDLTFDKTVLMDGVDISPATLESSRSPTLDLDSLYGAGPQDPGSAEFYSDGIHLKMGAADGSPAGRGFDLPRETPGQGATIPDERNDENLAVGQIHLAMIRFHNRVVDTLPASVPPAERFQKARRIVTKHYQWMIRTDYLPRICAPSIVTNVFSQGRKAFEVGALPTSMPTMPVEFAVAAYPPRAQHDPRGLQLEQALPGRDARPAVRLLRADGQPRRREPAPEHLDRRLPQALQLRPGRRARTSSSRRAAFNRAMRIDTKLVTPLRALRVPDPDPRKNLAFRNLLAVERRERLEEAPAPRGSAPQRIGAGPAAIVSSCGPSGLEADARPTRRGQPADRGTMTGRASASARRPRGSQSRASGSCSIVPAR